MPATFKIPSPIQSAGLLQFSSWGFHLSCIIMLASVVSAIVNRGRKSNGYMSNSIPSISSVIATIDVNICNIFYNRNLHQRSSLLKKFSISHFDPLSQRKERDYILKKKGVLVNYVSQSSRNREERQKKKSRVMLYNCISHHRTTVYQIFLSTDSREK